MELLALRLADPGANPAMPEGFTTKMEVSDAPLTLTSVVPLRIVSTNNEVCMHVCVCFFVCV